MEKVISVLQSLIYRFINFVEKIISILPSWLLIFIPLASLYLSFVPNENEEQYMQLAKQFVNPDWIYNSQNLTEFAGTRFIYQIILGSLLQYFSFEAVTLIFRLLLILLYSHVLSKLYNILAINKFQIFLHLAIFLILFKQSFFAGSYILVSVEPKGFAYLAVLWSFYYIFRNRLFLSLTLLIVASYLHILVGGYSFIYLLLTIILFRKYNNVSLKKVITGSLFYLLFLIPYILYLGSGSQSDVIQDFKVSPDWIYTYFRAPHHTALAPSLDYFVLKHLKGIIEAFIGLLFSITVFNLIKDKNIRFINQFVIVSLGGTLLLVLVAFIDRTGVLLKFYLYRINSLSTFFLVILITIWTYKICRKKYYTFLRFSIVFICFSAFVMDSGDNLIDTIKTRKSEEKLDDMCEYIKSNTKPDILIFCFEDEFSITRKTERNLLVVEKIIPAQRDKIPNWYARVLDRERVFENLGYLRDVVFKYNITHILVHNEKEFIDNYKLIYKNEKYSFYETESQ